MSDTAERYGKTKLIDDVTAATTGLKRTQIETIVNATLQTIADRLRGGQTITLTGFGTFSMKERRARSGVNPQTKQSRSPPAGARTGSRPVPC